MTQLFIDNQEVVLPSNLSVDLIVSNPLLTKEGTTTYDIDIDLRNQQNARIYRHINRINTTEHPKSRTAVFMVDGHTILKGTEIILKINGDKAKIQIVGGNSEFNYQIADLNIRDLDLGEIQISEGKTYVTADDATPTLSGHYPQFHHVFTPVILSMTGDDPIDVQQGTGDSWYAEFYANPVTLYHGDTRFSERAKFAPQPYILAIIYRFFLALGYLNIDMQTLEADQTNLCLFIVNARKTLRYNEMMPNWTAVKFIEEIEKFFNVVIKADPIDKTVSIVHQRTYYDTTEKYFMPDDDVIDIFETEFADSNDQEVGASNYDNVKYNLPSTDWYKYAAISTDLLAKCRIYSGQNVTFASQPKTLCDIYQHDEDDAKVGFNRLTLYDTTDAGRQLISRVKETNMWRADYPDSHEFFYFTRCVDFLHPVEDKEKKSSTTLNVVPAEVFPLLIMFNGGDASGNFAIATVPFCRDQPEGIIQQDASKEDDGEVDTRNDGTTEESGINEYIINGAPQETVSEQIFIAFYAGLKNILHNATSRSDITYPLSLVTPVVDYKACTLLGNLASFGFTKFDDKYDLSPSHRKHLYYSNNLQYDPTVSFTIRFRALQMLDPTRIFIIRNRAFYCKQLKYQVEAKGLNTIVEGIFHPVQ